MSLKALGIYVHIPFCARKCVYCDFLSYAVDTPGLPPQTAYVRAVCRELKAYAARLNNTYQVQTVYFGGGTPSVLEAGLLVQILEQIRSEFVVADGAEITVECNPGTTGRDWFETCKKAGCNRLSLGLQSTDNAMLEKIGRIHTYEMFLEQYAQARNAGFDNINVDLISALPGQNLAQYHADVERIVALRPEHIASYSLMVEEDTPLSKNQELLRQLPSEEEAVQMYEWTRQWLEEAGYHRYEISNYSLPNRHSRHNCSYWLGTSYLGIGLGASSYLVDWSDARYTRFCNTPSLDQYMRLWGGAAQCLPSPVRCWQETQDLSVQDRMEEFMFLGLRMMRGVSREEFARRFGVEMEAVYGTILNSYKQRGLLSEQEIAGEHFIALTQEGIPISNRIFAEFLF